jgi:hypothetical protein
MNSSAVTPSALVEQVRGAYRSLSPEEQAKIRRFAVRARLRPPAGELPGVDLDSGSDGDASLRQRVDEVLLRPGNEGVLVEAVTRCLVEEGDRETLAALAAWVGQAKREAGAEGLPGRLRGHPQAALLEALVRGGLLADRLPGAGEASAKLANKADAVKAWEALEALGKEIRATVDVLLGAAAAVDLGALERKLRRANEIAWALRAYAGPLGAWTDSGTLRELIVAAPDRHGIWAEALAGYLETVPVRHPLRRKREAAECVREAAVGELRNFATLGGVEETVPGPWEDAAAWWDWATGLPDEAFAGLEEWCGANSLDHLADFIAEAWSPKPGHG